MPAAKTVAALPARRPAEAAGLAGAVVVVLAYVLGLDDPALIVALTVIVGALPGVVTWVVNLARGAP